MKKYTLSSCYLHIPSIYYFFLLKEFYSNMLVIQPRSTRSQLSFTNISSNFALDLVINSTKIRSLILIHLVSIPSIKQVTITLDHLRILFFILFSFRGLNCRLTS